MYANIRFPDGRETTVLVLDLAPCPRNADITTSVDDLNPCPRNSGINTANSNIQDADISELITAENGTRNNRNLISNDGELLTTEHENAVPEHPEIRRSARVTKGMPPVRYGTSYTF